MGAMASFLYALEVGERDFPELKRDQRWVGAVGGGEGIYMYIWRDGRPAPPIDPMMRQTDLPNLTCTHT